MKTDLLTLSPIDDAGEAAQAFERYDLVSAPVVDANGRLVGRLTVDEVVDVIREESEEEALATGRPARGGGPVRQRLEVGARTAGCGWRVNLCTAFFASRASSTPFEGTIEQGGGAGGADADRRRASPATPATRR
ncbi:MAG: CBS domain-containing protein [Comamonadaceae bacterium]|nr:CBS domain-containing protein [Comamonadaceae bacterium]